MVWQYLGGSTGEGIFKDVVREYRYKLALTNDHLQRILMKGKEPQLSEISPSLQNSLLLSRPVLQNICSIIIFFISSIQI